jgi:putative membrane protein
MWNAPYGMMGGWDGWGWFWPFHFIIPLLVLAIIITIVVLLVRYAMGWSGHAMGPGMMGCGMMGHGMMGHEMGRRSPGLDALEERYARGEINRDEYLQKKRDITGQD